MNKNLMPDNDTVALGEFDPLGFIMRLESEGMPMEEMIDGFQHLIDSGYIMALQGSYGRTAQALIDRGLVSVRKLREMH